MEAKKQAGFTLNMATGLMLGVALGIVLLVIGAAVPNDGVRYAGVAITTLGLFGAGFLLKEENGMLRLGLMIAGGLLLSSLGGLSFTF